MDRRKFIAASAVGTIAAGTALTREMNAGFGTKALDEKAIGDAEKTEPKTAEQLLKSINEGAIIIMPSRQIHPERLTEFYWEEFAALKGLTYQGLIQWAVDFRNSEYFFFANKK